LDDVDREKENINDALEDNNGWALAGLSIESFGFIYRYFAYCFTNYHF
jgi:hypothetical protein